MTTPKLNVGRPKKEDAWKAQLIKLMRKEDAVIEKAKSRKQALALLLEE